MARQRPPQAIRDAMAEVGMGSLKNYEAIIKASASANADASRAFYPILRGDRKVEPMKLMPSEQGLVALYEAMRKSIAGSPQAVKPWEETNESGLVGELEQLRKFYFKGKGEAKAKETVESMWDLEKGWVVPELLPLELRPKRLTEGRKRKRRRIMVEEDMEVFEGNMLGADLGVEDDDGEVDGHGERKEDEAEVEAEDPAKLEEDEELELGADYQTGTRFDDDDGYEEHDSGAEEATF